MDGIHWRNIQKAAIVGAFHEWAFYQTNAQKWPSPASRASGRDVGVFSKQRPDMAQITQSPKNAATSELTAGEECSKY